MHLQVMVAPVPNSCLLATKTKRLVPGAFSSSLHLLLGLQSLHFLPAIFHVPF